MFFEVEESNQIPTAYWLMGEEKQKSKKVIDLKLNYCTYRTAFSVYFLYWLILLVYA